MPFFGRGTQQIFKRRSRVRHVSNFALFLFVSGSIAVVLSSVQTSARQTPPAPAPVRSTVSPESAAPRAVLDKYCITCHNQKLRTAGLALDSLDVADPIGNAEVWEKV